MADIIETAKKYRPDKNSVKFGEDGGELKWKVKPGAEKTKFNLEWNKNFEEDDVEITVKIGGEVNYFTSPKGTKDIIQSAEFSATKKF
jgi:hypothetical protein